MEKLKIYLDNCCFNRPYDDQSALIINLETLAKLSIQDMVKRKILLLTWSFMLDFENSENPDEVVKSEITIWKKLSDKMISMNDSIVKRAKTINTLGINKKDSLHISCAIESENDYFITVDKGILKKANLINDVKIVNPIEFISIQQEEIYEN